MERVEVFLQSKKVLECFSPKEISVISRAIQLNRKIVMVGLHGSEISFSKENGFRFCIDGKEIMSFQEEARSIVPENDNGVDNVSNRILIQELNSVNLAFPKLMSDMDTFIFDPHGVLWQRGGVIPGSPEFIDFLLKNKKKIIILTNNATKSRTTYAKKLVQLGYHTINKNWLVNPATVVAEHLLRDGFGKGKKSVYLIGSKGIKDEMDEFGIEYFGDGPETILDSSDGSSFAGGLELPKPKEEVGAVVVGYETRYTHKQLMIASKYLANPDCLFFATNEYATVRGVNPNSMNPGAGSFIAAIERATNRKPITVGKPNSPVFEYIQRKWNIDPERTVMVGDRTNTDVKFGRDHGLKTLLVLLSNKVFKFI